MAKFTVTYIDNARQAAGRAEPIEADTYQFTGHEDSWIRFYNRGAGIEREVALIRTSEVLRIDTPS